MGPFTFKYKEQTIECGLNTIVTTKNRIHNVVLKL